MKQYNIRLDEQVVKDAYDIAKAYNSNLSELIREGLNKVLNEKKNDVYYKLTHGIKKTTKAEAKEIMNELSKLTDEDLAPAEMEVLTLGTRNKKKR